MKQGNPNQIGFGSLPIVLRVYFYYPFCCSKARSVWLKTDLSQILPRLKLVKSKKAQRYKVQRLPDPLKF